MPSNEHTPEQVMSKLREAEVVISGGGSVAEACGQVGVTEETFYQWRNEYGDLRVSKHLTTWQAFLFVMPPQDEWTGRLVHRWLGYPIFATAVILGVKANYVTTFSFLLSLAGAAFFLQGSYAWTVGAVVLLNLGLAADSIDGQVARYRGESSDFGQWLASVYVTFKAIAIWSCLAIGVYWRDEQPFALILGMVALGHLFFTYYLMRANKAYAFYRYGKGSVRPGTRHRLGLELTLGLIMFVFTLLDQLYLLLIVFAGVGAVPWTILLTRAVQSYMHKDVESASSEVSPGADKYFGPRAEDS